MATGHIRAAEGTAAAENGGSLRRERFFAILQSRGAIVVFGTLGSNTQQLVSGVFLIAVVLVQASLTRKQRL